MAGRFFYCRYMPRLPLIILALVTQTEQSIQYYPSLYYLFCWSTFIVLSHTSRPAPTFHFAWTWQSLLLVVFQLRRSDDPSHSGTGRAKTSMFFAVKIAPSKCRPVVPLSLFTRFAIIGRCFIVKPRWIADGLDVMTEGHRGLFPSQRRKGVFIPLPSDCPSAQYLCRYPDKCPTGCVPDG